MKAAKQYKEQWEELNWLRLIYLGKQISELFNVIFKKITIALNLFLFISYLVIKTLWLFIKLLLLTEPSIQRIERDETWIFRQIK